MAEGQRGEGGGVSLRKGNVKDRRRVNHWKVGTPSHRNRPRGDGIRALYHSGPKINCGVGIGVGTPQQVVCLPLT